MGKVLTGKLSCLVTGLVNPIALRKAKTVCNFGLSECSGVNQGCNSHFLLRDGRSTCFYGKEKKLLRNLT